MNYKDKILYVLTFLSFSSINFLNVSYSFVKRFIETDFKMTSTQVGVADGLKFFGTIVGLFFYINFDMIKKDKIPLFYCLSIILTGFSMGTIPLLSVFKYKEKWAVFLFNFLGGMTKAPSWPLLLQLVKETIFKEKKLRQNYDQRNNDDCCPRESAKNSNSQNQNFKSKSNKSFIIWTSLTLLGNIFGLVIQQNLVYKFDIRWQLCMMVSVVCLVFFSIVLGLFYYSFYVTQNGHSEEIRRDSENVQYVKDRSLVLKCLELLFLTKNCLFTWSLVLILSIHSVMMAFLPLFLYKIGYHAYEGYILGWYNMCVVLGTLTFTCLDLERLLNLKFLIVPKNQPQFVNDGEIVHEIQEDLQIQNQKENQCSFETVNLISLLLLVGTCIFLISLPCPFKCSEITLMSEISPQEMDNSYKLLEYFVVIGMLGFFLGGPLNKYESSELISVLRQFEQTTKQYQRSSHDEQSLDSDQVPSGNQTPKIFIGTVQILSYMTVMFFLILTGHIIQTNILAFFYLIGILSAFILVLDIIKIIESKLRNID